MSDAGEDSGSLRFDLTLTPRRAEGRPPPGAEGGSLRPGARQGQWNIRVTGKAPAVEGPNGVNRLSKAVGEKQSATSTSPRPHLSPFRGREPLECKTTLLCLCVILG